MIGNISSSAASTDIQQYRPAYKVASAAQGTTANEDTVQLSDATQRYLTNTKTNNQPASISEVIKEAADGNIAALAKLALVG